MANVARETARHSLPLPNFKGLYRGDEDTPGSEAFHGADVTPADKARALRQVFDRDAKFAGSYSTSASSVACGNTHGLRRYSTMSVAEASVIAMRGEESGYATEIARDGIDIIALGDEAVEKAWRHGEERAISLEKPFLIRHPLV